MDTEILNSNHNIADDEGLILFLHNGLLHEVMIPLLSYKIRSVIVNMLFPWRPSVLTDNHDGIYQLLRHLHEKKCRKVIYAARFSSSQSCVNENERLDAFLLKSDIPLTDILTGQTYSPQEGEVSLPIGKGETVLLARNF